MKTNVFLIAYFVFLMLVSCEEVIEVDLGSAEPTIVIEGMVTTDMEAFRVKISQSVDYAKTNSFPPVSEATVRVWDEEGYSEILEEKAEGIYETADQQGEMGKTYFIEVSHNGAVYSASSTIPQTRIPLNSISYEFVEESLFSDEGYYVTAYFQDPADEVNFYRLKIFVNGEPYFFEVDNKLVKDDNFWLINDKFFNGKLMDFEFPHTLKTGDSIDIELHQVDKATYDYYRTLVELMGVGGVAPSNPLSNWSNGALGYFGAISKVYGSIVIQ